MLLIDVYYVWTSCLNQCTYCKTKHARGELGSYSPADIVERARQSFQGLHFLVYLTASVSSKCYLCVVNVLFVLSCFSYFLLFLAYDLVVE